MCSFEHHHDTAKTAINTFESTATLPDSTQTLSTRFRTLLLGYFGYTIMSALPRLEVDPVLREFGGCVPAGRRLMEQGRESRPQDRGFIYAVRVRRASCESITTFLA